VDSLTFVNHFVFLIVECRVDLLVTFHFGHSELYHG